MGKGRKVKFYLRPKFYHMLDEDGRPEGWEEAAKQDELLWQDELEAKAKAKAKNEQKLRALMEDKSNASDDDMTNASASVSEMNTSIMSESYEGDEPPGKKQKMAF
eukprot:scaffold17113_cov84-Skeletonema_dohrnii-CCMP3373.AAC.1